MKERWDSIVIGNLAKFYRGLTYSGKDEVPFSNNVVLRSNNIDLETNTLNYDELKYISDNIVIPDEKRLKANSIFMCMSNGSKQHLGKVAFVDKNENYAFGGFMGLVVPSIDKIFPKYLFWYFCSPNFKRYIVSIGNGANINNIKFSDIAQKDIPVPPLSTQQTIVSELDKINELIALKKSQLKDLDALAQSIFYEMFGDPITNEKEWDLSRLMDNVVEMFLGPFGSSLKVDSYVPFEESYCMVYEQKHAIQKSIYLDNHYINEEKYNSLSRFKVEAGDFIMSCRGTIGKLYRLPSNAPMGIIHPSLMKIRIKESSYNPTYFAYMLPIIVSNQNTYGNCVQMAIIAKALGNMQLGLPPLSLQQQFAERVESIERLKQQVQTAIKDLETLLASRMQYWFD